MLGHHRPASEMPFKWRFAGGSLMAANVEVGPPPAKLSGSAHETPQTQPIDMSGNFEMDIQWQP